MKNNIKNILFMLMFICIGLAGSVSDDIKPGMVQVHGGTLFWSVITFLILLVILKKIAWSPIIEALESRESEIKEALNSAETARENAEKASKDYDNLAKKARAEAQEIIAQSKINGEKVRSEIKELAEKEANDMLLKAKSEIANEREKAISEIKSSIIDFSMQAASKVVERNLDSEDNKRIINDTLKGIGKA